MKRNDVYFEAMKTRDHRFDGRFFVGVKTTGIYCRPICPAKPKRENVEFFESASAAEIAGYRPCLRCRPESAPFSPAWIGKSATVQRAIKVLYSHETIDFDENTFADRFGVSARHLRRLFVEEIGKTPKQLAFDNRLNLARKLIAETSLPITDIAYASGFLSVRRFNDAFKDRFHRAPSHIRRLKVKEADPMVTVYLSYRPPYDFAGLYLSYKNHRVGELETFENNVYGRIMEHNGEIAQFFVCDRAERCALELKMDTRNPALISIIISKVRSMFDLHTDPVVIATTIEKNPRLKKMIRNYPGIRLPSGWDPFEVAVGTILGQLVSVERGRVLVENLICLAGREAKWKDKTIKLFPTAQDILATDLGSLKTTQRRRETLKLFARAYLSGDLSLDATQDADAFMAKAMSIRGIGPWTVSYIALKALRHTDAFPESDLILNRQLKLYKDIDISAVSPWRGYLAALMWRSSSNQKKETAHD